MFDTCGMEHDRTFALAAEKELSSKEYREDVAKASLMTASGEVPAYDDPSVFQLSGDKMTLKRSNKKPIAVMVYGPSAAGKSFSTQKILQRLDSPDLKAADNFITVDGGIMRERSRIYGGKDWQRGGAYSKFNGLVQLAHQCGNAGWKDQVQSNPFKKEIRKRRNMLNFEPLTNDVKSFLKEAVYKANGGKGANVIIPGTLGGGLYSYYTELRKLQKLRKKGYTIVLVLVYASKQECTEQGTDREKTEGKKYSNGQWRNSVDNAIAVMNTWSSKYGGLKGGQKMYVVNNRNVVVRNGNGKIVNDLNVKKNCTGGKTPSCKRCPSGILEIKEHETLHLAFGSDGVNEDGKPLIRIKQNMKTEGEKHLFSKDVEGHGDLGMREWVQMTEENPVGCPPLQGASAPSDSYQEPQVSDERLEKDDDKADDKEALYRADETED